MKTVRLLLAVGSLFLLTTLVASADPPEPPYRPGPVIFLPFEDCWMPDAEWEWYYFEDCNPTHSIVTNSKTGVMHWTAQAQLPEGAAVPERGAVHWTYENTPGNFACWWDENTFTTNYIMTISPQGRINVHCHFKPGMWQPD